MIRSQIGTVVLAGHKITWASTAEREALRRMTIESQIAT
jgi:hypothetical protein